MEGRNARLKQVMDDVVVGVIVAGLAALAALGLRALGYTSQDPLVVGIMLAAAALLVLLLTKTYTIVKRWLTLALEDGALAVDSNHRNSAKRRLKAEVIDRALRAARADRPNPFLTVVPYTNQKECEHLIKAAYTGAKSTKILAIRASKYFAGNNTINLLGEDARLKRSDDLLTQVLVLDPYATDVLQRRTSQLNHKPVDDVSYNMQLALGYLKRISRDNPRVMVKCYSESPEFKLLIFDHFMFVSFYLGPKNDDNAPTFRLEKDGNPLFQVLEQYFDDLWHRSKPASEIATSIT